MKGLMGAMPPPIIFGLELPPSGCKAKAKDLGFKAKAKNLALRPRPRPNVAGWIGFGLSL